MHCTEYKGRVPALHNHTTHKERTSMVVTVVDALLENVVKIIEINFETVNKLI